MTNILLGAVTGAAASGLCITLGVLLDSGVSVLAGKSRWRTAFSRTFQSKKSAERLGFDISLA